MLTGFEDVSMLQGAMADFSSTQAEELRVFLQARTAHVEAEAVRYMTQARQRMADVRVHGVPGPCRPRYQGTGMMGIGMPEELPNHAFVSGAALAALAALQGHGEASLGAVDERTLCGVLSMRPVVCNGIAELLVWDDEHSVVLLRWDEGLAQSGAAKVRGIVEGAGGDVLGDCVHPSSHQDIARVMHCTSDASCNL